MTIANTPTLPRHTPGTTPVPAALRPIAPAGDLDLIGRVLIGLMATPTDPPHAENHWPDNQSEEEERFVHDAASLGEEVMRLLAPAEPGNAEADAWNVVTLTRPRGSTVPVWKPFAAYGPMPLEKAHEFLAALGDPIGVAGRADFPILDRLPRAAMS
ncbi:hypothetical protein D5S18_17085 [Nocardia panacis]|uniref:Uncharacterized protein n=1 Tax=Nocardia panacis TaxID=2340916 RepID=A0A3A4KJL4_9NOCA|nr:hypothetical protein [Nocardia panacis]RJO75092.1 hypothetical protein D5S18_17085 [Nocardia panacis]